MDYYKFKMETYDNKWLMMVDIIIKSIKIVKDKSQGDFNGDKLIFDILDALNVTENQLSNLNK